MTENERSAIIYMRATIEEIEAGQVTVQGASILNGSQLRPGDDGYAQISGTGNAVLTVLFNRELRL